MIGTGINIIPDWNCKQNKISFDIEKLQAINAEIFLHL